MNHLLGRPPWLVRAARPANPRGHSQGSTVRLQVRVLVAALDASVLVVLAIVRAHASVRALQQVALAARAAHIVQQDRQRAALAKLRALGGSHRVRKAQLATHHGGRLGVPGVVAHRAPASAYEHFYAAAAGAQACRPYKTHRTVLGLGDRGTRTSPPSPASLPGPWSPGGPRGLCGSRGGRRGSSRGAPAAGRLSGSAGRGARSALLRPDELYKEGKA